MVLELVLTLGLVSTILGTASKAQNVGPIAALAVGGYIALAGLWASPITGVSMNPARSFGPALLLLNFTHYWAYLVGPIAGGLLAVGVAYILRGPGGDEPAILAAQGRLGDFLPLTPKPQPKAAKSPPNQSKTDRTLNRLGFDGTTNERASDLLVPRHTSSRTSMRLDKRRRWRPSASRNSHNLVGSL